MVLAPLEIVDRGGCAGVVAVRIRGTGKLGGSVTRSRIVTVGIPVQTLGSPVENSVEGQPGSRRGGEHQRSGKIVSRVSLAENQVPVAPQDSHVVAMLVERMLPAALADDAQQHLLAWMHVGIAVVGLVRILEGIVRVHVVGHGAPVNQEICRMVRLGRDVETASGSSSHTSSLSRNLQWCLDVNDGIHFSD